jgi:hypothetical protein
MIYFYMQNIMQTMEEIVNSIHRNENYIVDTLGTDGNTVEKIINYKDLMSEYEFQSELLWLYIKCAKEGLTNFDLTYCEERGWFSLYTYEKWFKARLPKDYICKRNYIKK